jgi:hypothetical protein
MQPPADATTAQTPAAAPGLTPAAGTGFYPAPQTEQPPARRTFRGFLGRFFGVPLRGRTWLNIVYLLLSFPLGIIYFSILVSLLPTGLGTVIVWIGIPILIATAYVWWAFAALERHLSDLMLGTHLAPAPQPWRRAQGLLPKVKALFGAPSTWKDLGFVIAKFPLGILSFVVVLVSFVVPVAFILAPIGVHWSDWAEQTGTQIPESQHGFYLEFWHIDTTAEALVLVPLGIIGIFVGLWVINGLAALCRMIAAGLLETAPAGLPPAAAQPAPATFAAMPGVPGPAAAPYGGAPAYGAAGAPAQLAQPAPAQETSAQPAPAEPAPAPATPAPAPSPQPTRSSSRTTSTAGVRGPSAPSAPSPPSAPAAEEES